MGGGDAPAFRKAYPSLHLPPDFARLAGTMIERGRDGVVAPVGADYSLGQRAGQTDRRSRRAERCDLVVAVKDLRAAVADGTRILAEKLIEGGNVVNVLPNTTV